MLGLIVTILILITRILYVVYPDRCYNEYSDADGSNPHIEQDVCDRNDPSDPNIH